MKLTPTVHGIGYMGYGPHKSWLNGKPNPAYVSWSSMLERCYCPKKQAKFPTYIGCTVDPRWLNFQAYADFFEGDRFRREGYHLDKDILSQGNKIYSPENCCFVPAKINTLLGRGNSAFGDLPAGVSKYKNASKKPYVAFLRSGGGKRVYLGTYSDPMAAHDAYKIAKKAHITSSAIEYEGLIDDRAFLALVNWTVS